MMGMSKSFRRWRELDWRARAVLGEAGLFLAVASLAIHLFPFRRVVAVAARRPSRPAPAPAAAARATEQARWAVEAMGRRLPWRIVCFQKGLALHMMLRRRGIASLLHYGVGQDTARGLTAHVWISTEGRIVIGGEEAPSHRCLATFPAAQA